MRELWGCKCKSANGEVRQSLSSYQNSCFRRVSIVFDTRVVEKDIFSEHTRSGAALACISAKANGLRSQKDVL